MTSTTNRIPPALTTISPKLRPKKTEKSSPNLLAPAALALWLLASIGLAQQTPSQKKDTTLAPPKGPQDEAAAGLHHSDRGHQRGEGAAGHRGSRGRASISAIPTTVLLEDGKTMLIVYPKGHGRGAIVYKRSTDGGKTWSERLPTPKSWETSLEVPTLHRVVDAAGKKRIIMFSGLYPIRMAVTEDDGANWSELKPIGDFGGVVTMATVIGLKTPGHYLAFFHDDGRFIRGGDEARYHRQGSAQRPHLARGQAVALLGLHHALEGRRPHLERARADRHAARCEPLRAGRAAFARWQADRRAAARELAEIQFVRHLLGRRRPHLDRAARAARRAHRRPAHGEVCARRPALHQLPRHHARQPHEGRLGRLGRHLRRHRERPRRPVSRPHHGQHQRAPTAPIPASNCCRTAPSSPRPTATGPRASCPTS